MIRTLTGRVKKCQRPGFYAIALLLPVNTATVGWLMHAGISDFPGWPFWRLSLVISAVVIRMMWSEDDDDAILFACWMSFCWALLPAGWLAVAFWNWHLPVADPALLLYPSVASTFFGWGLPFMNRMRS